MILCVSPPRGNRFLFDYREEMDPELQEVFDLVVSR